LNLVSEVRRREIFRWGFHCSCPLCASHSKSEISDRQRRRVHEILGLLKLAEYRNPESIAKLTRETLDLCETEGMKAQTGDFYRILARVYTGIGEKELAKENSELAIKTFGHYVGYDCEEVQQETLFLQRLVSGYYG